VRDLQRELFVDAQRMALQFLLQEEALQTNVFVALWGMRRAAPKNRNDFLERHK
jgi:hypothetical protein